MTTEKKLTEFTLEELKTEAKRLEISNFEDMEENELLEAIRNARQAEVDKQTEEVILDMASNRSDK